MMLSSFGGIEISDTIRAHEKGEEKVDMKQKSRRY